MPVRFVPLAAGAALVAAFAVPAFAQDVSATRRNVDQQQRIENGLQSGQLTTREAAGLERGEARINRIEANAGRDGTVSSAEQARIRAAQNRESRAIHDQKHDAQVGNPASASSQRMQADVQRSVNQQARIGQGEQSGQLTTREASRLERGQARTGRAIARAGAAGPVPAREDRQSGRIFRKKHNGVVG